MKRIPSRLSSCSTLDAVLSCSLQRLERESHKLVLKAVIFKGYGRYLAVSDGCEEDFCEKSLGQLIAA